MRIKLTLLIIAFCTVTLSFSQSQLELAEKYLEKRGELVFTFTANNFAEANELSRILSFVRVSDSSNPLEIRAYGNKKNFSKFLEYNLPFEVDIKANEPKDVIMFDPKVHKKNVKGKSNAYTLSFPLSAYPTYAHYAQQMQDFVDDHPAIAELVDIGGTVQGDKRLLFIKLSDNVGTREAEPRVMYTATMHGDELAGYPGMLNLIDYLITAYENTGHSDHTRIKNLLDNTEVWINPLANPDASFWDDPSNTSVTNSRRENANNVDLNRNYPDNVGGAHPDGEAYQTETLAFMQFASDYHFVISANLHGGIELVNYPFDNTYATSSYPSEHLPEDPSNLGPFYTHPDTDWFEYVSVEYASQAQSDSPSGYMTTDEDSYIYPSPGVTHGAEWYRVYGGRQDYMNFYHQTREITLEISDEKTPPSTNTSNNNEVIDIWNYNQEAYIKFLLQGMYGFRGIVKDATTGNPIDAKITIVGRDDQEPPVTNSWVETETIIAGAATGLGDFYRPIEAGTYDILIEADCYESVTFKNQTITNYETIDLGEISLNEINSTSTLSNLNASPVSTTFATLNWNSVANATNYDIRYREVGSSTWTTDNSTSNSLNISGLNTSTEYEFQVRVTCDSSTSLYSSSESFTTTGSGTVISSFSYYQSFENTLGYWSQGSNGTDDDINWFIDSNGTPSSNTGPSLASNGTYYLYTEASTNVTPEGSPDKYAILNSPYFDFTGYKNAVFSFDYHWYGANIDQATLIIEISNDNGLNYTQIFSHPDPTNSSDSWVNATIDLSAYNGDVVTFRITGKTGNSWSSDMAIDNISITAEVDASLGIQDELLSTFTLYPNPSNIGEIRLKMPNEIQEFNIEISNILGQKLYTNKLNNYNNKIHTISTQDFNTGVYFVSVSTPLGKSTKKLVIQ